MSRTPKKTRAIAKRTIAISRNAKRLGHDRAVAAAATTRLPTITVNVMPQEAMLLVVIPGCSRTSMAVAYSIMSHICITCDDDVFQWMNGSKIGPGDRLRTCTTIEIVVPRNTSLFVDDGRRVRRLGEIAFASATRALKTLAGAAFDVMLAIHDGTRGAETGVCR